MRTQFKPSPLGQAILDLQVGEGLNVKRRSQAAVCNLAAHIRRRRHPERRFRTALQKDGTVNIYRVSDAREAAR